MKQFKFLGFLFLATLLTTATVSAQTVDFEDLPLAAESFWNGSDGSSGFESNGAVFSNSYNADWASWDGFAYANLTDTTSEGYSAQYNAIPGAGAGGSQTYAVAYCSSFAAAPPTITLDSEQVVTGAYFTNSNYAYYSMTKGDDFAKKFAAGDWFKLTVTGIGVNGVETGRVEFKLADGENIVNTWTWVDLRALGAVKQLTFALSSTDNGDFGMNTPAYFCMDDFNKVKNSDGGGGCFINSLR
ncbi:MAG: DUF4465 domain-containing protein [Desulfosalsimonadaceae bacterium]|nr:DUF4465 domain-containing protein [Desulfosalsimonadaceae bacterium]